MTRARPTIYLVDDDAQVLKALSRLLSGAGYHVEACTSAEEFLARHDPDAPGCAVLDLCLDGMDGLAIQRRLAAGPTLRQVVFLTGQGDVPSSVTAMKGGAVDFLTKPVDAAAMLAAIDVALEHDRAARREEERRRSLGARLATLTPREHEVLEHVVAGRLNKQIAADLGITEKTIKVHRARVMHKMGVRTLADLVRIVTQHSN